MNNIKVLGLTTNSEFFIGSKDRNFRINEYLVVEDKNQGDLVFEVMEANTFNRYIPLNIGGDLVDSEVINSLENIGYIVDDETIYIAKCRLLNEANFPIETGSDVREPEFYEIRDYLLNGTKEESLLIGSIKNTDKVYDQIDEELKDSYHILDEEIRPQKEVPFLFNINEMNQYPHIGIFGGSGSGKSYGIRVFIEEIMKKGIPTIIFDPHYEMDFQLNEENPSVSESFENFYDTYVVGNDVGVDFKDLNSGELKKLLSASSELTEAMESTIDLLFGEFGYGKSVDINTFETFISDLISMKAYTSIELENAISENEGETRKKFERLLTYHGKYDKQTNDKTLRGIAWRLRALRNDGVFSNNPIPILDTLKSGKTAVLQGGTRLLEVFASYIMNKLYNMRRGYKDNDREYFPPFIIVTDEAHSFAPKGFSKPSKSIIKEIAQEGRKYGVFLVLATQRPTLLDETVTAQLNSKFIFRTVRGTDIQTIREETDISSEEAKRLPYLKTGDLFASIASMGRTIFTRVRLAETVKPDMENPFDELKNKKAEDNDKFLELIKDEFPIMESDLPMIGKLLEKEDLYLSVNSIKNKLDILVKEEVIEIKDGLFKKYILKEK